MEIIVFDSNSIFALSLEADADKEVVLNAYMKASGERRRNIIEVSHTYSVKKHSDTLYSVVQETEEDSGIHHKQLHDIANLYFRMLEIDMTSWWVQAYPIVEHIAIITGAVVGTATITYAPFKFVKWVRDKARPKNGCEYQWIQDVISKESWNISELSEKLSIPKEQTKELLKGFGYVWDSRKMLYVETKGTRELREIKKPTSFKRK